MVCRRSDSPDTRSAGILSGVQVVVVDDEDNPRELFREVLTLAGADVRAAASAREALALIEQHAPEVLVSDVMMPNEDGYWLIDAVRALGSRRLRALAVTGNALSHSRDELIRAGYDAYLKKPVSVETFRATVARLAGRSHGDIAK